MAKNKLSLQFDGLEDIITKLEESQADIREAVGEALAESKKYVTDTLVRDTVPANYPAKGRYSTGELARSIDKNNSVKWQGLKAEVKVGYKISESGLASIMLLYGTPKMKKSQKLYNDIFGSATKKKLAEIQQDTLNGILERVVDNGR